MRKKGASCSAPCSSMREEMMMGISDDTGVLRLKKSRHSDKRERSLDE
jgi:hypothetical protein